MKTKWLVNVHSCEAFFALPKHKRERYGIYLKPIALPWSFNDKDDDDGWNTFCKRIRKEYPMQGFIREWLFTYDNPVYAWFGRNHQRLKTLKWNIERFISPMCPRFRKAFKRWQYKDVRQAITDVNFALMLDFYYEEVVDGHVNWHSDDKHKKFYTWLNAAVYYIEVHRPELNANIDKLYETQSYKKIHKIEKQIHKLDTKYLKEMIMFREYFWT